MKKIFVLVMVVVMVMSFAGCNEVQERADVEVTISDINLDNIPKLPPTESEYLAFYRNECQKNKQYSIDELKLIEETFFVNNISNEEKTFEKYNEIFYNFVIAKKDNDLILLSTNRYGDLDVKSKSYINYLGNVHGDVFFDEHQSLMSNKDYYVTYEGSKVCYYQLGKVYKEVEIPKDAIYCGMSYFEGFIFRQGDEVYAHKYLSDEVICIAHNVKQVITAEYAHSSDPWSQPLFLMKDGSIKCYISWQGNGEADDASHLVEIKEGGYISCK